MLGGDAGELLHLEAGSKMGPLIPDLFSGDVHLNLGDYEGDLAQQTAKRLFFEILGRQFVLTG